MEKNIAALKAGFYSVVLYSQLPGGCVSGVGDAGSCGVCTAGATTQPVPCVACRAAQPRTGQRHSSQAVPAALCVALAAACLPRNAPGSSRGTSHAHPQLCTCCPSPPLPGRRAYNITFLRSTESKADQGLQTSLGKALSNSDYIVSFARDGKQTTANGGWPANNAPILSSYEACDGWLHVVTATLRPKQQYT